MSEVEALQESAASGHLIIVAGAGVSLALATPTHPAENWRQLVSSGLKAAKVKGTVTSEQFERWSGTLDSSDIDELLGAAEFVSAKLGGPDGILYSRWLDETFRDMKPKEGPVRASFSKIAKRGLPICTLNYDTLLEQVTRAKTHKIHQTIVAARWIDARKLRASLSYRVAMRRKSFSLQKAFSIRCLSLYAFLLKLNGCFRFDRFGITQLVPRPRSHRLSSALS